MNDEDEFNKRWESRFQAYAWVLFMIATVFILNEYSDELATLIKSMKIEM